MLALGLGAAGCGAGDASRGTAAGVPVKATESAKSAAWDAKTWRPPALAEAPKDSLGAAIRRGYALMTATHDSLPKYVGGNMRCTSCHLDGGLRATAAPLTGVYARFPKYMDRTGAVIPLEDRVNYCFTRSLAGSKIPTDSREMQDIVAYLAFISRDVPVGKHMPPGGLMAMPKKLVGDTVQGRAIFAGNCARCHGTDGAGTGTAFPAVWGPKSFSVGASMARQERAASFIFHNMPFDKPGTLTEQQAFDVAAYVVSKPRPDSPGKEKDWPSGGTPYDVPYTTSDHRAFNPPPLIGRPGSTAAAIVPPPARAAKAGR
jgi:thiosulfate dehydrogenase